MPCLTKYPPVDKLGRSISFTNVDMFGGFVSKIVLEDGGELIGKEHVCYVNSKECYADEYRFGGIVVQVVSQSHEEKIN